MKNMKFWRTALVATLVLTVMLSVTGGTIAWFTDEVTSASNVIAAGTLDVELSYKDAKAGVDNWTDASDKTIFNYKLWEPGYTDVKYVQVKNAGTLAFNFRLTLAPTLEVVEGETNLANVIEVYMGEGTAPASTADLHEYAPVGTIASLATDEDGVAYGTMRAGESAERWIALHMQETAGNEYQGLSVGEGFNLKLEAIQATVEYDSFDNQYDAGADFTNVWDGSQGEVPAEEAGVITISTAAELAAFADAVNNGTSYSGKTIKLGNNIDLNNKAWTPIGAADSTTYFQGTFDGQGHTISGLYVDKSNDEYMYSTAGFFGWIDRDSATIKNVNFDGATVKGSHWVGVVAGYMSGEVSNCHVTNATVTGYAMTEHANGDKVGGLVGLLNTGSLLNNSVKNSTISGNRDVAGLAGVVTAGNTVTGNHVENVNVYYTANYAGEIIAPKPETMSVVDSSNTATNVLISVKHEVSNVTELKEALSGAGSANAGNNVITLTADLNMQGANWTPINVDGYNGADIVTIEGNGHTITNLSAPLFAGGFAGGSGIVIKDLTIANSAIVSTNTIGSGAFIESVDSMDTITLINCHLLNSTVTGGDGSRTGGLIGWTAGYNDTSDGPVKTYVTIENCSVIGCTITCDGSVGGIYGHAGNNSWTYSTVENCTVKNCTLNSTDDGDWRVGVVVGTANVGEMTISNITESGNTLTQTGKTAPAGQSNLYGRFVPGETGKLIINGSEVQ